MLALNRVTRREGNCEKQSLLRGTESASVKGGKSKSVNYKKKIPRQEKMRKCYLFMYF